MLDSNKFIANDYLLKKTKQSDACKRLMLLIVIYIVFKIMIILHDFITYDFN